MTPALHDRPAELLQHLLRFDTTNPPGGERECANWVADLLREGGLDTTLVSRDPDRPNVIARLPGEGTAPPLLLQGHVDVVPTEGQRWSRDPFGAEIADGYVWGRGALDMKGGVAMMLAAVLRLAAAGERPAGDVVLAVLADEEAGGDQGARFLVDEHPHLFAGVRHALGEFGGFTLQIAGRRFYPVQVAEKQMCWMRATVRGPAGHGSLAMRGGTMAALAGALRTLDRRRLPVHVPDVTRRMVEAIADELPAPLAFVLRRVLDPRTTDRVLDLLGERGRMFDPMLHNTVNATIVRAGDKVNVVPGEAIVELDGRLLPGQRPDDLVAELRALLGPGVELEVLRHEPGPADVDLSLWDLLAGVLREMDPEARPVPMLLPAVSDGRTFARLGIQTYGFLPMQLPSDLRFTELIHAADERIPVDAVAFGADAIHRVLRRYGR